MQVIAPFCRELAPEILAVQFDLVFPGYAPGIASSLLVQPDSASGEDFTFAVCDAAVAEDRNLFPLCLRHVSDAGKPVRKNRSSFPDAGAPPIFSRKNPTPSQYTSKCPVAFCAAGNGNIASNRSAAVSHVGTQANRGTAIARV